MKLKPASMTWTDVATVAAALLALAFGLEVLP
jgi:hypothetical protein